jgi:hypothetical protein
MQSGSKHQWTTTEDVKLVECLVDMANSSPTWKVKNGFKSGYLLELERMMLEKTPGCKLRAQPHIENRYKLLKKQYGAISYW